MAFTSTVVQRTVFGNMRVIIGKYVNDGGSTGGNITTGLTQIWNLILQPFGTAVGTGADVVNETVPAVNAAMAETLTVVTNANESGTWMAIGT